MQQAKQVSVPKSTLDGLWLLLTSGEEEAARDDGSASEGRVPVMARAGDDRTYLLGFKNMHNARSFIEKSALSAVEPRMVVKGNKSELLRIAQESGAVGVLVDYDPATQKYESASQLY